MTKSQIISAIRTEIEDSDFPIATLYQWIDEKGQELHQQMIKKDEGRYESNLQISIDGSSSHDLPANFHSIIDIRLKITSRNVLPVTQFGSNTRGWYLSSIVNNLRQIVFTPDTTTTGERYVRYSKKYVELKNIADDDIPDLPMLLQLSLVFYACERYFALNEDASKAIEYQTRGDAKERAFFGYFNPSDISDIETKV